MSDKLKPLIVEGERVGEYSNDTFCFEKYGMATVELWDSPRTFDAYQYDWDAFKEFYKPDNEDDQYAECEDVDFTPGMNGINTVDIEKWLLEYVKEEGLSDPFYFIVHWRRYATYTKHEYEGVDGKPEFEWALEDMGASSPDRYYYKDGKIQECWSTPMEDDE